MSSVYSHDKDFQYSSSSLCIHLTSAMCLSNAPTHLRGSPTTLAEAANHQALYTALFLYDIFI